MRPKVKRILDELPELTLEECRMILHKIEELKIAASTETPKPMNILDFKGFDQETWRGVDVEAYIQNERDSWERGSDDGCTAS